MAKGYAKPFYDSPGWAACRRSYISKRIKIDGGLCEACHSRAGYIVHHKIMIDESNVNDPNITLNENNLQFVCKPCHDRMENHFVKSKRADIRYMFDDFGQPYIPSFSGPNKTAAEIKTAPG